jgi:hypothetical protein
VLRINPPDPPTYPLATPVHPLVGKEVRIEWQREGVEKSSCEWRPCVVLDVVGGLIKLRSREDDTTQTPFWSPISDIFALEEVAEIVPGEE